MSDPSEVQAPPFKVRELHKYSDKPMYEALITESVGKGWFPMRRGDGRPARFNRAPKSYEEARWAIIEWNRENNI